jgi:hypothetical protein
MMTLRYGVLNSGVRVRPGLFSIALVFFTVTAPAVADVNSWTKPTSGNWQEIAFWSLGELPDATQDVVITNGGWKAVAINAQTAQNFSDSMSVHSLRVTAPPDSFNTLLMNFAGFGRPLQTGGINIETNGALTVQSSWLEVIINSGNGSAGYVQVSGSVKQGDFSWVTIQGGLDISSFFGPGAYFFTNGLLRVDAGEHIGGPRPGILAQYGGTNTTGNLVVSTEGELDLYGGQITSTNGLTVGSGDFATSANFYQYGGNVNANTIINGHYFLNGGTITGNMLVAESGQRVDGTVVQTGGTNSAISMDLAHPNRFGGRAFYTLSNGVINVDTSTTFRGGLFSQYAGRHTIVSNLNLEARDLGFSFGFAHADYTLWGGTLSAGGLPILASTFQQNGGTNSIAGNIVLNGPVPQGFDTPQGPRYNLTAGFLAATNVFVSPFFGGFRQSGGISQITGTLALKGTNFGGYQFSLEGGTLIVKDIVVSSNAFFQHTNGTIVQSGLLTLNQGGWRAANGDRSLGPLLLTGGSATNSAIVFPGGSAIFRLANSSSQPWSPTANLVIENWHGSVSGGGQTQLYFANNASGLTAQQLSQIKFAISGGLFSAKILATGEVVPQALPPLLGLSRSGNTLTLTWEPGLILQSSTNVIGTYTDVPGATSPYSVAMTGPQRFFRLRQ